VLWIRCWRYVSLLEACLQFYIMFCCFQWNILIKNERDQKSFFSHWYSFVISVANYVFHVSNFADLNSLFGKLELFYVFNLASKLTLRWSMEIQEWNNKLIDTLNIHMALKSLITNNDNKHDDYPRHINVSKFY